MRKLNRYNPCIEGALNRRLDTIRRKMVTLGSLNKDHEHQINMMSKTVRNYKCIIEKLETDMRNAKMNQEDILDRYLKLATFFDDVKKEVIDSIDG